MAQSKYIYKITNILNGKCYIGQAKNYKQRFAQHKNYRRGNSEPKKTLYKAFDKYGLENFTFESH